MVVYRQKKRVRYRGKGSGTHGGGARKKRRGAGSRGGRGNAGTGKRAGHHKFWGSLGSRGFIPRRSSGKTDVINVGDLTAERLTHWVSEGKATKEGNTYIVDLTSLGYGKLLSTGNFAVKAKITIAQCSPAAAEKVKAAGGEVVQSS
nr:50S ribosomal protein L15P [uncultured archaeon]